MAILQETKYPNNVRILSGSVNFVRNDDVILMCDTSLAAVTIDLAEIPLNYWSTTYKLYVIDFSENSSVNNIIINAPIGFNVNNASSITIDQDGGGVLIQILSSTQYLASFNLTSGVSAVTQIIAGSNITVTPLSGLGAVTINANFDFVSITVLAMQALITAGTVSIGTYYLITDANLTDGGVILQGTSATTISIFGKGLFLNPDYNNISGNNLGLWSSTLGGLTAGVSICIWSGIQYLSVTGLVGTNPASDLVNWIALSKSGANTYQLVCDDIKYDISSDLLFYRSDIFENEVERVVYKGLNSISQFQWGFWNGTNGSYGNKVIGGGYLDNLNQFLNCACIGNEIKSNSAIEANTNSGTLSLNSLNNGSVLICDQNSGSITYNCLSSFAEINISINSSNITKNNLHSGGSIACANNQANINFCEIGNGQSIVLTSPNALARENLRLVSGFSNWVESLDLGDVAIYSGTVLTIPSSLSYAGHYLLNDSNKSINEIINLPTNHACKFSNEIIGEFTSIVTISIGSASTNEIVAAQSAGAIQLVGRTDGDDFVLITKSGNLNAVVGRPNVYQ